MFVLWRLGSSVERLSILLEFRRSDYSIYLAMYRNYYCFSNKYTVQLLCFMFLGNSVQVVSCVMCECG